MALRQKANEADERRGVFSSGIVSTEEHPYPHQTAGQRPRCGCGHVLRKDLTELFLKWYTETMEPGALDGKTKKLIAYAVANAIQEPYCIDSYASACVDAGISPEELAEALNVAAVTTGGPKGTTPVVEKTGQRFKFNLLSIINNRGEMRFMLTEERVDNHLYIEFRRASRRVFYFQQSVIARQVFSS